MQVGTNCSQLLKHRLIGIAGASCLVISGATVVLQCSPSYALDIPTTVTSSKNAPFSQVFFTGSVYAVKDKDYKPSEPSIGFFSLWSQNPTNKQLLVAVQYCLSAQLTESNAHLTAITLLDNNQPLVTINQSIKEDAARLRLVQPRYYSASHGIGDPFDDQFLNPLDEELDYGSGIHIPAVTCSSGNNIFDFTKLAGAVAQLPNRTLQVKLAFNNGEIQNWHLGKKTVQAIKNLLAISQPPKN